MKRTTKIGNVGNLYTEGNPSLGVPATVVGADELNNIQEELCTIATANGAALDGNNRGQALAAILELIRRGGAATVIVPVANNQAVAANVASQIFDAASVVGVRIPFFVSRVSSSAHLMESGVIHLVYDSSAATWRIAVDSRVDDSGVTFGVTAQGQITYTSTNMGGTGYVGNIRIAGVMIFKVA